MTESKRGGINTWTDLREAAKHSYSDAITILATIAVVEKGNQLRVIEGLNAANVGRAVAMLRDAAFFRVQLVVVRAFDPVQRSDDIHLRAAVDFLREPGRISQERLPERQADLHQTIALFDTVAADPRLTALKHMRNKELAHWARYGDEDRPMIRDLFEFAEQTCRIWERLSFGAGTVMVEVDHQIDEYREAAAAFWSHWES